MTQSFPSVPFHQPSFPGPTPPPTLAPKLCLGTHPICEALLRAGAPSEAELRKPTPFPSKAWERGW